jgi:hypothetical protein
MIMVHLATKKSFPSHRRGMRFRPASDDGRAADQTRSDSVALLLADRHRRPRLAACHANASTAVGDGFCGNFFSYASIAD